MGFIGGFLGLFAVIAFCAAIILVFFKSKRRLAKRILIGAPIVFVVSAVMLGIAGNQDARDQGFANATDKSEARKAGYEDAASWNAKKEADKAAAAEVARIEVEKKEAADRAMKQQQEAAKQQQEAAAKAKEEACRSDLSCWADKHLIGATSACRKAVEKLAQYDFEWTDSWADLKFSRYRWANLKGGIVTYIGDKIKYQNGFGAFQNHIYSCDYDPEIGVVLKASAKPGRL